MNGIFLHYEAIVSTSSASTDVMLSVRLFLRV